MILMEKRNKRPSKSIRKYIRQEKARLRRSVLDSKEQKKQINDLYKRISTDLPKRG